MNKMKSLFPGILLCIFIAIPAWLLGKLIPIIGGPVFGILLGIIAAVWKRPSKLNAGIKYTSKKILQYSIILLGFEMNLYKVFTVGTQSLLIIVFTLSSAFMVAWLAGRSLKLTRNTSILIGVGTAICGGSAIAATAPILEAEDSEVTYAISTIFLFNVIAVFIFPFIGHLLGMSDAGFGMWAGTAINDTSSVVAAGYSFSDSAGSFATIVKLTRTLMIIPITLALAVYTSRKSSKDSNYSMVKIFPWFILGFLAASIISTSGILPYEACISLSKLGRLLIIMAMTAVGLNTNFKNLVSNGIKPILLGLCCWFAVASVSLLTQLLIQIW